MVVRVTTSVINVNSYFVPGNFYRPVHYQWSTTLVTDNLYEILY